jgi:hypothetical protein
MGALMPIKNVNISHRVINAHGAIFHELIDLIIDCLKGGGIQVAHTTNRVIPDLLNVIIGSTIFLPSETLTKIRNLSPSYIVFQLEALNNERGHASKYPAYIDLLRGAKQIWDYSLQNVRYLAQLGLTNVRYIPIGYSRCLERINDVAEHDIDILFYGSTSTRRNKIMEELNFRGFKAVFLFGEYGPVRDAHIARAKLVLNMHCLETTHLEQVRLSYLLNNKRFIVSETSDENPYGDGVVFCDYQDIVTCCTQYLKREMELERIRVAKLGYDRLQQIPMASSIINALAELAPN